MPHCTNCGNPLPPGSTFCTHCGAPAASTRPPAAPPPGAYAPPPPPPPAKGGGLGKVLLITCGVVVLLGVLAIGGLVATGFWVKKKVETVAGDMGLSKPPAATGSAKRYSDACALLSAAEASRATGLTIQRTELRQDECLYFGSSDQAAEQGHAQVQEAMRKLEQNKSGNEKDAARAMEDLMKGMAASGRSGEEPLFQIKITYGEEAGQQESAYRVAMGMLGAAAGADKNSTASQGLEGVGDRAYLAPLATGLFVRKGDAWIEVGGPGLPNRQALIALGRAVAARL